MIKEKIKQWQTLSLKSLIGIALQSLAPYHDDFYTATMCIMHRRADPQTVAMMQKLFRSRNWRKRVIAVDVMSELHVPIPPYQHYAVKEAQEILQMAVKDNHSTVAIAALYGISFRKTDKALHDIIALSHHEKDTIRRAVVNALYQFNDEISIKTLIKLAEDSHDDIREYATFALGTIHADIDTPEIRAQLVLNCNDKSHYVADDALTGLIYRKDVRAFALLQQRLARSDALNHCIIDAIDEVDDASLAKLLNITRDKINANTNF